MTLLDGAQGLATIVGLICNWRQERGAVATERFQDFLTWLTNHNFQEISAQISASAELQRDLHELLRQDSAVLAERLDFIAGAIASIACRIDSLAPIATTFAASTNLSDQAAQILIRFSDSQADRLIFLRSRKELAFMPAAGSTKTVTVAQPRFLENDLSTLELYGLVQLSRHNSDGDPIYVITRFGDSFAAQIKQSTG